MYFVSKQKRHNREVANRIYTAIVEASRQPAFFVEFEIPDTLDGRFEMLSLHMFIALNGMVESEGQEKVLAQNIMELFVRDMDAALREIGVSDIKVPKRMKALYGSFGGRIAAYTLAVGEGDEALHAALARNIFADGGAPENVVALSAYVAQALEDLSDAARTELPAGRIAFPDALSFNSSVLEQGKAIVELSDG